jgi:hypothetical protein
MAEPDGASSSMSTGFEAEPGGRAALLASRFSSKDMGDGIVVVWCCSLSVDSSKRLKVTRKSIAL